MNELAKSATGGTGARGKQIVFLWIVLFIEVLLYPLLAKWGYQMAGGQGGIGDEISAYWLLCVLPGALVFGAIATLFYSAASRRNLRSAKWARFWIWFSNAVLLSGSIAWYFHLVRRFLY